MGIENGWLDDSQRVVFIRNCGPTQPAQYTVMHLHHVVVVVVRPFGNSDSYWACSEYKKTQNSQSQHAATASGKRFKLPILSDLLVFKNCLNMLQLV